MHFGDSLLHILLYAVLTKWIARQLGWEPSQRRLIVDQAGIYLRYFIYDTHIGAFDSKVVL